RLVTGGMVDLVGELLDEGVDAPAEVAVVAGGRRAFEVAPAGVDVVDVVTAGSWALRVGPHGRGVDVVAVGDLAPDPGTGETAFPVAPVGLWHEAVLDQLPGQALDEVTPFVVAELP